MSREMINQTKLKYVLGRENYVVIMVYWIQEWALAWLEPLTSLDKCPVLSMSDFSKPKLSCLVSFVVTPLDKELWVIFVFFCHSYTNNFQNTLNYEGTMIVLCPLEKSYLHFEFWNFNVNILLSHKIQNCKWNSSQLPTKCYKI